MNQPLRDIEMSTAEIFTPLLEQRRYKGADGGRGSGKSHFFGELAVEDALRWPGDAGEGLRMVSIREVQKDLKESSKLLIEDKLRKFKLGVRQGFRVYTDRIGLPGDGVLLFQGMKDHTAESIKSLEGFHRAWVEEAQTLSQRSLTMLRPTIRWENLDRGLISEMWFSWNARRRFDPVDVMFKGKQGAPSDSAYVHANWRDNPFFPHVLEIERQDCLAKTPEEYDHIWEGDYVTVAKGAYYARHLHDARATGRIGNVTRDSLLINRLFVDIGGTGARSDNFVIWVAQFVGTEIWWIDHYEVQGQPIDYHLNWLRDNKYKPENSKIWLPHDGETNDKVYDVSYESAFTKAGYEVEVIPNQGRGAAMNRIERARLLFPAMRFDKTKCQPGLEALGWYHPKIDDKRDIDLGPDHDWASHSSDAFGLGCVAYEQPTVHRPKETTSEVERMHHYAQESEGGWMA